MEKAKIWTAKIQHSLHLKKQTLHEHMKCHILVTSSQAVARVADHTASQQTI